MAVTQAIQSGAARRAVALLGVFIVAKLAVMMGQPLPLSLWTPVAYLWQDLLVVLVFWLLDVAIRRSWFGWTLYSAFVAYAAVNVPIARVLSSPLTWPMMRATGGALSDSIKHHATLTNLILLSLTVAAGNALPWLTRRLPVRIQITLLIFAVLIISLGSLATRRVATIGLERNAVMALVTTALPHWSARDVASPIDHDDWRVSPFGNQPNNNELVRFRGAAAGRNVVLIVLESAGAEHLQPYGASRDPMPNLSELARTAWLFETAYAVYPESIKALFTTLCSRYPALGTDTESYARITTPSWAAVLKTAGYRTALFHSGRFMYLGMEAVVSNRGFDVLEDAGAIGGNHESSFGVDEPSTVRRALAWLDTLQRGERFFLTYLPIAGHHPYETPEPGPFPEQTEAERYLNALHYADAALGTLLQGLRARGLEQNTLFVIFGDHGQAFGRHPGNYGHSLFLYEENLRVPYLIALPGLIQQQVRLATPISLIDTAPTILDLLGLPSPADYQGQSALAGRHRMALFYTDYSRNLLGLRDGDWKYVDEPDAERAKLFDLREDSAERQNLAPLHPERVAAYRHLLTRWNAAQRTLILQQTK